MDDSHNMWCETLGYGFLIFSFKKRFSKGTFFGFIFGVLLIECFIKGKIFFGLFMGFYSSNVSFRDNLASRIYDNSFQCGLGTGR